MVCEWADCVAGRAADAASTALANAPADVTGVVTAAVRGEQRDAVRATIETLDAPDREVLVLRGIEQQSLPAVASALGVSVEAAGKRYQRALVRLRRQLPDSVFHELEDE